MIPLPSRERLVGAPIFVGGLFARDPRVAWFLSVLRQTPASELKDDERLLLFQIRCNEWDSAIDLLSVQ
jgi:hypothetical protein